MLPTMTLRIPIGIPAQLIFMSPIAMVSGNGNRNTRLSHLGARAVRDMAKPVTADAINMSNVPDRSVIQAMPRIHPSEP